MNDIRQHIHVGGVKLDPTGCRCCDQTDDSPDPVAVRLEREVAVKDLRIVVLEELAESIRDKIHAHNPLMSDGPLAYRVQQLCDDLIATRNERDEAREAARWLFNDDNGHATEEEIFTRYPWLEETT